MRHVDASGRCCRKLTVKDGAVTEGWGDGSGQINAGEKKGY